MRQPLMRSSVIALLGFAAFFASLNSAQPRAQSNPPELKLLISTDQHTLTQPYPARITLQIHNSSQHTLWLYHRASAKRPPVQHVYQEGQPVETTGGSTLEVVIQPADAKATQGASPAQGTPLEYIGLPMPKLEKLAVGGDYEERAVLHLTPAMADGMKPVWGAYRLTVIYGAKFSTAEEIQRNLGTPLWQGEVTSNALEFELRPAPADAVGAISGSAIGRNTQPTSDIRVSLNDSQDHLIDQQVTGGDGTYSFEHLPPGLYWITGRRETATEDTAVFHSVQLTAAAPHAADQIDLTPPEIYEAKKVQHKPVLFKVVDSNGQPAPKVLLDATWSNGPVLDDVKATSDDDGTAIMELIPGRNFVTLRRHGCRDQDERADVSLGLGVDGFKVVFECTKK
jgi:hypothetical protein